VHLVHQGLLILAN